MGKFMVFWELDKSRVPLDPKERGAGWSMMINMIKQDMAEKKVMDWGAFIGELKGYHIYEGSEVELMNNLQRFVPLVTFTVHPVASVSQVDEMVHSLSA